MHSKSATSADVTEGSAVLGGIWAREAYDWSEPNTVRATVQDSNVFQPGGTWKLRATPRPEGGCYIEVLNHRQARGFKGRVIGAMLTLLGSKMLPEQLQQTLDAVANETAPGGPGDRSRLWRGAPSGLRECEAIWRRLRASCGWLS